MRICVHASLTRLGGEEPHIFYIGRHRLIVAAILKRWSVLPYRYYEVVADDGRHFVLRQDSGTLAWELCGCYREALEMNEAISPITSR